MTKPTEREMRFEEWAKGRPLGDKNSMGYMMAEAAWDAATEAERGACAKHLKDAAARIAPAGKRTNQYDQHMADVLGEKADELLMRANADHKET